MEAISEGIIAGLLGKDFVKGKKSLLLSEQINLSCICLALW